ncbi:MAG: sugar porter family MFS transporter [Verrucomicrobiota bacterium]
MSIAESAATPAEPEQKISLFYLYMTVLVAAVGGFLFGYDLSLISGAIIFLKTEFALTPGWVGLVMGSAILGCPFGPLMGVWLADAIGRKRTLVLAGVLFMASAIGCALAGHIVAFIVWRFVGGMGVGLASTVSPMFIAEIAPAHLRGRLVMVFQLAVGIGLSMSVFVDYLLSYGGHWRWMFATQAVPVVIFMLGLMFVPESPRWLAAVGRVKEALAVLVRINGPTQGGQVMKEIQEELLEESGGFSELFRPGVRLALLIGIGLMVYSQIDGVNMIILYTPTLFVAAGITNAPDAILNSVYLDAWILICTGVAFWLIRVFPRRNILIGGGFGMVVGHILMFLSFTYRLPPLLALAAMLVPVASYVLTLGPLSWVVISEMFPNRVRGKAMCIATCSMFAASFITANLFPVVMQRFIDRFGQPGATFLIFAGICAAGTVFVWRMLPETKDKTLEEMSRFWLRLDRDRAAKGKLP